VRGLAAQKGHGQTTGRGKVAGAARKSARNTVVATTGRK